MGQARELHYRSFSRLADAVEAVAAADLPGGFDFILTLGDRKSHEFHAATPGQMKETAEKQGFFDVSPYLVERQNISVALPIWEHPF